MDVNILGCTRGFSDNDISIGTTLSVLLILKNKNVAQIVNRSTLEHSVAPEELMIFSESYPTLIIHQHGPCPALCVQCCYNLLRNPSAPTERIKMMVRVFGFSFVFGVQGLG